MIESVNPDKQFVLTVKKHPQLGYLFIPYLAVRGETFYSQPERIAPESADVFRDYLSDDQYEICTLTDEYSDKAIFSVHGLKKETQVSFFSRIDEEFVEQHLRKKIDQSLDKIFNLILEKNIPFYLHNKEKSLYINSAIYVNETPADIKFHFIRKEDGIEYTQAVHHEGEVVELKDKEAIILINSPCRLILENRLYWFSDSVDGKKLKPFFSKDSVFIPSKLEKKYFESFICNAVKTFPVEAEGFDIETTDHKLKPVLNLEKNWQNFTVLQLYFHYGKHRVHSGITSSSITELQEKNDKYVIVKTERDLEKEQEIKEYLTDCGLKEVIRDAYTRSYKCHDDDPQEQHYSFMQWLNKNSARILENGIEITQNYLQQEYHTGKLELKLKFKDDKDWFDLKATVNVGDIEIPFLSLRKNIIQGIREFELPNGKIIILPEEWFAKYKEIFLFSTQHEGDIRLKKHHWNILKEQKGIPASFKKRITEIDFTPSAEYQSPPELQAELRTYQEKGFQWLMHLQKEKLNGCLADDMGLGKTLQTIALLCNPGIIPDEEMPAVTNGGNGQGQLSLFDMATQTIAPSKYTGTSLIVMPTSLIHNWRSELLKFAPHLKVYEYTGIQREKKINNIPEADIVLSSYGVVRNDSEMLQRFHFNYLILDESQLIKNPGSKTYQAILTIKSHYKLALSGTPVENSLTDLWAQLNFLNRGMLGSMEFFKKHFVRPIEQEENEKQEAKLRQLIHPFILRRTKSEVAKELPPLTEQTRFCEMSEDQKRFYEEEKSAVRNMIMENIEKQGIEKSSVVVLSGLNRLRQIACHPKMINEESLFNSGKFEEVIRNMENLITENHKVLIFSSFVKHLNIFKDWLEKKEHNYSILTGETKDREAVINKFREEKDCKVFLISLKAGGLGLNLTEAEYVFILDPWWNPASERQAIDRAYRIGQEKNVFVYRYISKDSVEEKIVKIQEHKKELADTFVNNNNPLSAMSIEDLNQLLD